MKAGQQRCEQGPGSDVEREVMGAIVAHNADVNFDPQHPKSILDVSRWRGRLGAKHPRGDYASVLSVPVKAIAAIWKNYMTKGDE